VKVHELIEHLKTLPQDLPVYIRSQNDYSSDVDYWEISQKDIIRGEVMDAETEKDYPAVIIGDDRV